MSFETTEPAPMTAPSPIETPLRMMQRAPMKTFLPILIGDGMPFFEKLDRDIALHLAEVKAYKSGMVELRYELRR
jgi:hypothetical protein